MKVAISKKQYLYFLLLTLSICSLTSFVFAIPSCGADANPGLKALCDIIVFVQGRIGRSIAGITVVFSAMEFMKGEIKWQAFATLAVGLGMFWAPKTIALFLLPNSITGIMGDGYETSVIYTPDEIISCICPALR